MLIAVATAGRAAFFMLPNFKPVLAIVIISGAALGKESGFLVGAMSAFVSNFLFGQGPWTPWQMIAMAVVGYLAGLIFHRCPDKFQENRACGFRSSGGFCYIRTYSGSVDDTGHDAGSYMGNGDYGIFCCSIFQSDTCGGDCNIPASSCETNDREAG